MGRIGRRQRRAQRHRVNTQIPAQIKRQSTEQGVAVVAGTIPLAGNDWPIHYTVGLTRHEGHPEIVVVGECFDCAERMLRGAADVVRRGARLAPGWGLTLQGWLHVLVEVERPEILDVAQDLYRLPGRPPVPALQAIGTDEYGELPWESGIGSELMLGPAPVSVRDR